MTSTLAHYAAPCRLRAMASALALGTVVVACKGYPPTVEGEWHGVLRVGAVTHEAAMHVHRAGDGNLTASLDALDENVMGLQAADVILKGNKLSFTVPAVKGSYLGTLSPDGKTIEGIWSKPPQPASPLVFARQSDASTNPDGSEH